MDTKRILLVEDDQDFRESLQEVLEHVGYDVYPARTGSQATEFLVANLASPPHAVILDLMIPIVTGWQIIALMKNDSALQKVPILVITGVSQDMPSGASIVLRKPVDASALVAALAGELSRISPTW